MNVGPITFLVELLQRARTDPDDLVLLTSAQVTAVYTLLGKKDSFTELQTTNQELLRVASFNQAELDKRTVDHIAFRLNPVPWVTSDRRKTDIADMETSHILNSLKAIQEGRIKNRYQHTGLGESQWAEIMRNEVLVRVVNKKA